MAEEEHISAAAIDQYWDAMGRSEYPAADIGPGLAETIARLHELAKVPEPDPDFVARLERVLVTRGESQSSNGRVMLHVVPVAPAVTAIVGLPLPREPRVAASRHQSALTHLASAALLAITLVVGFFVFGPRPERIAAPAVPAPASWSSTLLARVSLTEVLPGKISTRIDRWTLPDHRVDWTSNSGSLPLLIYVETGSLVTSVNAEAGLARAASVKGGAISMPVGTEIPLRSGDLLVVPASAHFTLRSHGEDAPNLLLVVLQPAASDGTGPPTAGPGIAAQTLGMGTLPDVAGTSSTVILRRLEAGPRTTMPEETTTGPELLIVEAGSVRLGSTADGLEVMQSVEGEASLAIPGGSRFTLRNVSNDPLVLLQVALIPTERSRSDDTGRGVGNR